MFFALFVIGLVGGGVYFWWQDEGHLGPLPPPPEPPTWEPDPVFLRAEPDEILENGQLTGSLKSTLRSVEDLGSGRLEVARFSKTEATKKADTKWNGQTVTEISCPVSYGYFVEINGSWELFRDGTKLFVTTPPLRAQYPSIKASEMVVRTETGWFRFNERDHEEETEDKFYKAIEDLPRTPEHRKLAEVEGKKTLEHFIRFWLSAAFDWGGEITDIEIIFPDTEVHIISGDRVSVTMPTRE